MLNHLLVAFETGKEDNYALAHAVKIARASGARITLLRLLDRSADKGSFVDPLDWHMRKLEVKLSLEELRQKLCKAGVAVHTEVVHSSEAGNLLHYGQTQAVDLVILVNRTERISDLIHNCIKSASIPILRISVATCRRPTLLPSAASRCRNIREPAKGNSRCSSSSCRISARSGEDTGRGR